MKPNIFKVNNTKKVIITGLVFSILFTILVGFIVMQTNAEKQERIIKITQSYAIFEDHVQTFLINKANIMKGFSAYIQTFENYDENDVYEYLEYLLQDEDEYINNIGIIKDTTITWNYPKNENQDSIGIDLSRVKGQAETIAEIKRTMKYKFDGPVKLVQGGTGYIMRVPIKKDGAYWGMISVVLKADKVMELFDNYAKETGLKVAIINREKNNSLVYGEQRIVENSLAVFDSAFIGGSWSIYVKESDEKSDTVIKLSTVITIIGLLLVIMTTYLTYSFFKSAEEIENKNDSLSEAIIRDSLTGIYSRNYFDARIVEETETVNRYGGDLSIIFFDLDHFKIVNDTYGHSCGDNVLKSVSDIVKRNLRGSDILARWGGEEFVILMPETAIDGAEATAEKLRIILETVEHSSAGRVTASFGVASYYKHEFVGSLFDRVDKALYKSKSNGRNRVTVDESSVNDGSVLIRIHWDDAWNSGNKILDMEHNELLKRGNYLIENVYKYDSKITIFEMARDLIRYASNHFENEEHILENENYEGLEWHREEHKKLIEKAELVLDQLSKNSIGPRELFKFLQNDLIRGHMIKEDLEYFHLFRK